MRNCDFPFEGKSVMTVRQAFLDYCASEPGAPAVRSSSDPAGGMDRGQLLGLAAAAATRLVAAGLGKGDSVVIALPTGPHFVPWYFGAQLIGAVAIPTEPFVSERRKSAQLEYLDKLAAIARPKALVVSADATLQRQDVPQIDAFCVAEQLEGPTDPLTLPDPHLDPDDTAHIQFSSGSTGHPKGCVLSHRAVCANARAWVETFDYRRGESTFNWMPLFHDFGLMVGVIAPVVGGLASILMSTESFVSSPAVWLKRMSGVGPVHSAGPSSAMGLLRSRLALRPQQGLALHDVRSLVFAAEPIYPQVAVEFIELVQPFGFRADAFFGAYGMAETTVLASGRRGLKVDYVRENGPVVGAVAIPATAADHTSAFVSVGPPIACTAVKVVDADGKALPERSIGHVLLRSTCLLDCYLNAPDETQAVLSDGWLRTGDIGYVADGELYFVTRSKDLINVAGRKIAPADVDHAVSTSLGLPVSRVASFGQLGDTATEGIVIAIESRSDDAAGMVHAAKLACYERTGLTPVAVVICAVGSIPKTTSGKVRRQVLRETLANAQSDAPADVVGA